MVLHQGNDGAYGSCVQSNRWSIDAMHQLVLRLMGVPMTSQTIMLLTHIVTNTHAITNVTQPAFRRQPWKNVYMGILP